MAKSQAPILSRTPGNRTFDLHGDHELPPKPKVVGSNPTRDIRNFVILAPSRYLHTHSTELAVVPMATATS